MELPILLLLALSFLLGAAAEQAPLLDHSPKKYNVTLNFDDLPTNAKGIGFHPTSPKKASFAYDPIYLDSFAVKDVAKAFDDLDSPIDITCASSAPVALFAKHRSGYPLPHISLHDLTQPFDAPRSNTTFNMNSLMISPTGDIKGDPSKTLVQIIIMLLKLPPDPPTEDFPPEASWPGLVRGVSPYPVGRHAYSLGALFGPGPHQSIKVDFAYFRKYVKGFGEGVDVMEFTAELFRFNEKKGRWMPQGQVEFCVDDVSIELVERSAKHDGLKEEVRWVRHAGNGDVVDAEDLGRKLWEHLGWL